MREMPPRPSSVSATGICARSASVRTCSMAPDSDDAVAGQDDRPLGIADQLGGLREAGLFNMQHGVGPIGLAAWRLQSRRSPCPAARPW